MFCPHLLARVKIPLLPARTAEHSRWLVRDLTVLQRLRDDCEARLATLLQSKERDKVEKRIQSLENTQNDLDRMLVRWE